MRMTSSVLCTLLAAALSSAAPPVETVKLTGWFACEKCMAPRFAEGDLHPPNPECSKECVNKGSAVVFVNEEAKALLKVKDHPSAKDDLGYKVEVTGSVDSAAGTLTITTVTRVGEMGASCSRSRPSKGK